MLISLSRRNKTLLLLLHDGVCIALSIWLALAIRLAELGGTAPWGAFWPLYLVVVPIMLGALMAMGVYRVALRYAGGELVECVIRAVLAGVVLAAAALFFIRPDGLVINRTSTALFPFIVATALAGSRLLAKHWLAGESLHQILLQMVGRARRPERLGVAVAIYGAGLAGQQLARALQRSPSMRPVAFFDDDPGLHHSDVAGIRVLPGAHISDNCASLGVGEILLAMPSVRPAVRRGILQRLERLRLPVRTVPSMDELASGKLVSALKPVSPDDLLGRQQVAAMPELLRQCLADKRVLVTGAGGSIGSQLCRQALQQGAERLIMLDSSEYNLYRITEELQHKHGGRIWSVLDDLSMPGELAELLAEHRPQTIYHAAAYKHVPLLEDNACASFRNNSMATLMLAQAALLARVEHFVLVSTDKAVRPTNIMGCTKRLAELVIQALGTAGAVPLWRAADFGHAEAPVEVRTRFAAVRFGNVLNSSGSVIPKFRHQIEQGGPVTVTHRDMTRFFMTIDEAVQLVIQAGALSGGGDLFVLDMGTPIKIDDLARQMIALSGLSVRRQGRGDIAIKYTGLRPGEKMSEELSTSPPSATDHRKIWRAREAAMEWRELCALMDTLHGLLASGDLAAARRLLARAEIGYAPPPG